MLSLELVLVFGLALGAQRPGTGSSRAHDAPSVPDARHPAVAHGTIPPEGRLSYGPGNVLDGRLDTAWCFRGGSSELKLYLGDSEARQGSKGFALDVYPGYLRNASSFVDNGAPKAFWFSLTVGKKWVPDPLRSNEDSGSAQAYFRCDGAGPCTVRVRVPSAMEGPMVAHFRPTEIREGLRSKDTCVSEIEPRFPATAPSRIHARDALRRFEAEFARRQRKPVERDGLTEFDWKLPLPRYAPCRAFTAVAPDPTDGLVELRARPGKGRVSSDATETFSRPTPVRALHVAISGLGKGYKSVDSFQLHVSARCKRGAVEWTCTEQACKPDSLDAWGKRRLPFLKGLHAPEAPSRVFEKKGLDDADRARLTAWAEDWVKELRRMLSYACRKLRCPAPIRRMRAAIATGAPVLESLKRIPIQELQPGQKPELPVRAWRGLFRVGKGELAVMHSDAAPHRDDVVADWLQVLRGGKVLGAYTAERSFDTPSDFGVGAGGYHLSAWDDTDDGFMIAGGWKTRVTLTGPLE